MSDPPSLWQLTAAAGALERRFLADATARVVLAALPGTTTLAAPRARLHGATVALRTGTQLATARALLELDGLARRIVLCTPDLSEAHLHSAIAAAEVDLVVSEGFPALDGPGWVQSTAPQQVTAPPAPGSSPGQALPPVATEWALFTSGTKGPPKLALHTLRSLTGALAPRPVATDSTGVWSTFYDIRRYGGLQILLRALLGGGSMLLSDAAEAAGDFLARAAAAGVTFLSGTPTHWRRALLSPAIRGIAAPDIRLSGEVADQAVLDKLREVFPDARICHAFASTEAGVAFEVADGLAGFPADWVGTTRQGVDVRVTEGTLRLRSARTASRYLGEAAAALRDAEDFVDTSDLIEQRGGRCHFAGRRDGVINVGGLKVHPEEVEEVVNRHPRVEMSLVRAKRSPIIGAVVVADVVLRDAGPSDSALEAEILESCRAQLAWYKVPAMLRVVASLPISAAGKLLRTSA